MKKIALTVALLAASLTFFSCSKKSNLTPVNLNTIVYNQENITVKVDPKVELLLIAFRLGECEPFTQNVYSDSFAQFVDGVDTMLAKQKNHAFVKTVKTIYTTKQAPAAEIVKISRYISDDFTSISISQKELPSNMAEFWKGTNLNAFISDLNDFIKTSNFEKIWSYYESKLKMQAVNILDFYTKNPEITNWISEFYFSKNTQVEFEFFASTLTAGTTLAPSMIKEKNKVIIQNYVPAYFGSPLMPAIHLSYSVTLEEFSENWDIVAPAYNKVLEKIVTDNQLTRKYSEYSKKSFVSDVAGLVCVFDYTNLPEATQNQLKDVIIKNFKYNNPDNLLPLLDAYRNNRDIYPDFDTFLKNYLPEALSQL